MSTFLLCAGVIGLLFHAALDWDVQFRRIYMVFGFIVLVLGVILAILPYPKAVGDQFLKGFVCMMVALLFLLAFLRHEDEAWFRRFTLIIVGAAGAVMAVVGLLGGNIRGDFLMPFGVLLALLGLAYLTAFIVGRGISNDLAYRAGLALGAAGVLVLLVALVRCFIPPRDYLVPNGLLLSLVGIFYFLTALGLCSDNRLVVLTVRELGSQFCSPIAYIVLFAYVCAHWLGYGMYLFNLLDRDQPVQEPMIQGFVLQWPTVFTLFIVPVLTMRLLSEEKRTGTLEVLLTAPVDEGVVVLSKFLAAWFMFLFLWTPLLLFLVALRIVGGQPFDYLPLFSFFTGLAVTGAGFIGMGVFFSSLTHNQIASGILAFVGMLFLTATFLLQGALSSTVWSNVFKHVSFINVWFDTMEGKLVPVRLLFFLSMAIFWLFLSVKVLEARKWT
jgi:ABC-type transport system involved in multi-copper enzyme maturation permease subunit